MERRGSLVEAPVGAAEGHFGPNRSSDQPGGRPAVRCSSKFRNWHNWTFRDVPAPVANQVESGPRELANVLLLRRGIVGELANALKIPL